MATELIPVLITKGSKGCLCRLKPGKLARLKRDFADFNSSNHPTGGSYTHYLHVPMSVANTSSSLFWRPRFSGSALKEARLDLKFDEISSITGE